MLRKWIQLVARLLFAYPDSSLQHSPDASLTLFLSAFYLSDD